MCRALPAFVRRGPARPSIRLSCALSSSHGAAMTRGTWHLGAPILLILLAGNCRGGSRGHSAGARAPADSGAAPAVGAADFRDPAGAAWRGAAPAGFPGAFLTKKGGLVVGGPPGWYPRRGHPLFQPVGNRYIVGVRILPGI